MPTRTPSTKISIVWLPSQPSSRLSLAEPEINMVSPTAIGPICSIVTNTGENTVKTTEDSEGRRKSSPANSIPIIIGPSVMSGAIGTKPVNDPFPSTEIADSSSPFTVMTRSLLGITRPTPSVRIPSTTATSVLSISAGAVEITT